MRTKALILLAMLVLLALFPGLLFAATTYTVTDFGDGGSGTTLRDFIATANTGDTIHFGATFQTITLTAGALILTKGITIDGEANNIVLLAPAPSTTVDIFDIYANACTITNLCLVNAKNAISMTTTATNALTVTNCRIGIDYTETVYSDKIGISINHAVGGLVTLTGNVISGISNDGINAVLSNNINIFNNYIGTDSSGMYAKGLGGSLGVLLDTCSNCQLGSNLATGNIISSNAFTNVWLNTCNNINVFGNTIGLNATKLNPLGSNSTGIAVLLSNGIAIGKRADSNQYYNVIGGNSSGIILGANSNGNSVQANYIGIWSNVPVPNVNGVNLQMGASGNLIGGLLATDANKIAGNAKCGVYFSLPSPAGAGNTVSGNYIGWYTGTSVIGNGNSSIAISNGNLGNLIGGNDSLHNGNVIAGDQMAIYGGANYNSVIGNNFGCIATQQGDTLAAVQLIGANYCTIGGPALQDRNYFCGGSPAISLLNGSTNNSVLNNWIGVLPNRAAPVIRLATGIALSSSSNNFIGNYQSPILGNFIAFTTNGIFADDSLGATNFNSFYANSICAFTANGIRLNTGTTNNGHQAPTISSAGPYQVLGSAQNVGDIIEVFLSDRGATYSGGSVLHLGYTTALADLSWSCPVSSVADGVYVCALATDSNGNTSPFSLNCRFSNPATPTTTVTATPTVTPTSTPVLTTPTATLTSVVFADLHGKTVMAYPNPGQNKIQFLMNLSQETVVKVMIYNLKGERLTTLSDTLPAGAAMLVWNCSGVPPGIYVARVFQGSQLAATLKVAVTK